MKKGNDPNSNIKKHDDPNSNIKKQNDPNSNIKKHNDAKLNPKKHNDSQEKNLSQFTLLCCFTLTDVFMYVLKSQYSITPSKCNRVTT